MTIGDFLSIYVVSLDKPFIFWESELLESLILLSVMVLDVAYDFYWLVIWVLVSVDSKYLIGFAIFSGLIFLTDLYQVYTFIFKYGDDDAFEEEEKQL